MWVIPVVMLRRVLINASGALTIIGAIGATNSQKALNVSAIL